MEWFDRRIHVHPRKDLDVTEVAHWPAPQKYQHYAIVFKRRRMPLSAHYEYPSAVLQVIQQRPDIDCLWIPLDDLINETPREALKYLLNRKDRAWSVCVYLTNHVSLLDPPELERALSILGNVQYLSFLPKKHGDFNRNVLDSLPSSFSQLKYMDLQGWRIHPKEMTEFFAKYSFAPLVHGLCLYNNSSEEFSIFEPVFSGEVASCISMLDLCFGRYSVGDISVMVASLRSLSSLETLRVNLVGVHGAYSEPLTSLWEWLSSPECPVKNLAFEQGSARQHQMFLTILPKIPRLKTIRLNYRYRPHDLKHLFPILLETPRLETIVLEVSQVEQETCSQILSFQLDNRPRMFAIQLQYGPDSEQGVGPQTIHHVSLIHQTLRNFQNSKEEYASSFPMLAWAIVLEKLGSAFDCPTPDIHALGVDVRFKVIQELLERPHLLLHR